MGMNPEVKKLWLEALRSGEYTQGTDYLLRNGNYCCLGVLCELSPEPFTTVEDPVSGARRYLACDGKTAVPPESVWRDWAGMDDENPRVDVPLEMAGEDGSGHRAIADLNDCGYSFEAIAGLIEEQL